MSRKRVHFAQIQAKNQSEWYEEKRLESVGYYLISDEKMKMYKDIQDDYDFNNKQAKKFSNQIYTLK